MYIFLFTVIAIIIMIVAYLRQPMFGKLPAGERLARMEQAANYADGKFHNLSHTPDLPEGVTIWEVAKKFLFEKKPDQKPAGPIPSVKTDLKNQDSDKDILVWFGHSSYFILTDGKKILVDPVFSGSASPLPFGTKAFAGTDIYKAEDMPEIDILFITHDHYDHLDYETIKALQPKVKTVICGLGVGAHFEYWGYDGEKIIDKDWGEKAELPDGLTVHFTPARHFSGRSFSRNKSLWASYVLKTPTKQIYIGGDSGYDSHFKTIGDTFGTFDLAILENGQYDEHWPYIHLLPGEILQAARDLNAKAVLPVHSSKFVLGNHPWYEPLELITRNGEKENMRIVTPMIGEPVDLNDTTQAFSPWWRAVQPIHLSTEIRDNNKQQPQQDKLKAAG
jgi:L-ascorbate metabolism protein UlaG (beta-lactamase superfamily)